MSGGFGEPQGTHDHSDSSEGKELRPGKVLVVPEYDTVDQAPDEVGNLVQVGGDVYKGDGSQYSKVSVQGEVASHGHSGPDDGGSSLGTSTEQVSQMFLNELTGSIVSGKSLTNMEGAALGVDGSGVLGVVSGGIGTTELDLAMAPDWTGQHSFGSGIITAGQIEDEAGNIIYDTGFDHVPTGILEASTFGVTAGDGVAGGGTGSLGTSLTVSLSTSGVGTREVDEGMSPTWTGSHTFDGGLTTGTLKAQDDSGRVTIADMGVTSASTAGDQQSLTFAVDGNSVATAYAESDGAGGIQDPHLKVHTAVGYPAVATPTAPDSGWKLFTDSADGSLKAIDTAGSVSTVVA